MGLYADRILPHLVHQSMRQESLAPYRRRVLAGASGRVLEIGIGSGMNLPLYPINVTQIIGLDSSPRLLSMAKESAGARTGSIALIEAMAERIPLDDRSIDTVVTTWTLCSILDVAAALQEMRRVLTANGRLLFAEHGRSPEPKVRRWQDGLTPIWKRIGGGCHLNRPIRQLIEDAGFQIEQLENSHMKGPKPMTYMYEGQARP
jgi:ubiquinone/menaquinone biosynthesis C-methylase UbiE